ncbi:hypothetical protein [Actinoplanes sp. NPDC051411]|uniref:hypothetical protein n=1 Tax=Actinoplanes sp. NPDC051411 TaxID=3155522 RepID=UPI00341A31C5
MWNPLHINVSLDDLLASPMIGAGGFTRDEARSAVQRILDADPTLNSAAEQWRTDAERVRVGPKV